ncbi:DUF2778 domain-containing protein [Xanthobacter sp. KR7-65]|uniref:DUF2778 domain-containing protein n=1 Tax=Xanthobacter sp. KR7-65 TaxID=3156612 RepID=UPI0032B3C552
MHDDDEEELFHDPLGPEGRPRAQSRRSTLVGIGSGIFAGLLVAAGAVWFTQGSFAFGVGTPNVAETKAPERPRGMAMAAAGTTVTEVSLVISSGSLAVDSESIYLTSYGMDGRAFALTPGQETSARLTGRVVPMPLANPLNRNQMAAGNGIQALQQLDAGAVPLPLRKPSMPDQRLAYASMPDASAPLSDAPSAVPGSQVPGTDTQLSEDEPPLPTADSGYAIYDIKAKVVYMPNGDRLEAHSGYGDTFDDVRFVSKRMVGPTPPNTYSLTMREALFHGTEAVRLNPVGTGKMYGRAGILAHPYLLGPRGDSNGCVSIKDYDRFLAAFKRGEVKKMIVVAELKNGPKKEENFLLSLLKPR